MKKLVIGAIVGGILVFLWHTLSWTVLQLHQKEYQKAPNEEAIVQFLNGQFKADGQYMVPTVDPKASAEEREKVTAAMMGKPWATINYHSAYNANMGTNIARGLLVDIIAVFFVCWVLMKNTNSTFSNTFISTLLIGIAGYLFIPYANYIWFPSPGATINFIDVLVSWGLCGIWLGWWLNRK